MRLDLRLPNTVVTYRNRLFVGINYEIYELTHLFTKISNPEPSNLLEDNSNSITNNSLNFSMNLMNIINNMNNNFIITPMRKYFEERPFPDITFKVQGQDIGAHKGFLTVKCSYFEKMFSSMFITL